MVPSLFLPHSWLPLSLPSCVNTHRGLEHPLLVKTDTAKALCTSAFSKLLTSRLSPPSSSGPAFSLTFLLLLAHLWIPFFLLLFYSVLVLAGLWSFPFIPKSPSPSSSSVSFPYFHFLDAPFQHFWFIKKFPD